MVACGRALRDAKHRVEREHAREVGGDIERLIGASATVAIERMFRTQFSGGPYALTHGVTAIWTEIAPAEKTRRLLR